MTKAVYIKFTRRHDICRLQVLMLDPNLIPNAIDVVIGDFLYELRFRVEANMDVDNPQPMDMDYGNDGDGEENNGDEKASGNDGRDKENAKTGDQADKGAENNGKPISTNTRQATVQGVQHGARARPIVVLSVPVAAQEFSGAFQRTSSKMAW